MSLASLNEQGEQARSIQSSMVMSGGAICCLSPEKQARGPAEQPWGCPCEVGWSGQASLGRWLAAHT